MNKRITQMRLQKEAQSLEREPIQNVIVHREGLLHFHFCFYGLQEEYAQGFYYGLLELPEDYPFSPPKIKFLTNNGRFEAGKSICTSFTHYHKETWSTAWNVRNILTAMISFMYSQERGIGGLFETPARRKQLADKSLSQNLQNPKFVEYFKERLIERELVSAERIEELMKKTEGKAKSRRRREKSVSTRADEGPNIGIEGGLLERALVEQDSRSVKRERVRATEMEEKIEMAQLQMLSKRQKLEQQPPEEEEEVGMEIGVGIEPMIGHKIMQENPQ